MVFGHTAFDNDKALKRIKELRDRGEGLINARRVALHEDLLDALDKAEDLAALRAVVRVIADRVL